MPKAADGGKTPSELSDREIQVLAAAMRNDAFWIRAGDAFVLADGWYTRSGRSMRNCGYIREHRGGQVTYLPFVPGAGKRNRDEPARLMEITDTGKALLRRVMGPDSYAQLEKLAREACRWREPGKAPGTAAS